MFLEKKSSHIASHACPRKNSSSIVADIGLRIVIQRSQSCESNVVVKSTLKLSQQQQPTSSKTLTLLLQAKKSSSLEQSCYLKSCYLCKKKLKHDKDIYMYRGDQGFCSVNCRSRQIVMDDKKELETSTKHMLASIRYRGTTTTTTTTTTSRCDTRVFQNQEDHRRRHRLPVPHQRRNRAIFL